MSAKPKRSRLYNVELTELVKASKPLTNQELAAICERLGDKLEAQRWAEADKLES